MEIIRTQLWTLTSPITLLIIPVLVATSILNASLLSACCSHEEYIGYRSLVSYLLTYALICRRLQYSVLVCQHVRILWKTTFLCHYRKLPVSETITALTQSTHRQLELCTADVPI